MLHKLVLTHTKNTNKVRHTCTSATRTSHRKHGVGRLAEFPEQEAGASLDFRKDGKHCQQHNLFKKGNHLTANLTVHSLRGRDDVQATHDCFLAALTV